MATYEEAYEASAKAIKAFKIVSANYLARLIGDDEYFAARAIYDAAMAEYDKAFEVASQQEEPAAIESTVADNKLNFDM